MRLKGVTVNSVSDCTTIFLLSLSLFTLTFFEVCIEPPLAQNQEGELIIAAASDLNAPLSEIIQDSNGMKRRMNIKAIFGSSGNLFSQIINGAPFDIFFSASSHYIEKLDASGALLPGSKFIYATGRIVLWAPNESKIDLDQSGIKALLNPSIKRIAIANPGHAPYGKAAIESMSRSGIYDMVKDKLIFGENISQAAHFVQSGAADIGIIALSIALSPKMKETGRFWLIPEGSHSRIEQWAAILKGSKNISLAKRFINHFNGEDGRKILSKYGFILPDNKGVR